MLPTSPKATSSYPHALRKDRRSAVFLFNIAPL